MSAARDRATPLRAVPAPQPTLAEAFSVVGLALLAPSLPQIEKMLRDLLVEFDRAKPPARRLYHPNEVAGAIGRSRATVYRCFDEGAPFVLCGDTRMVDLDDFVDWLKQRTRERQASVQLGAPEIDQQQPESGAAGGSLSCERCSEPVPDAERVELAGGGIAHRRCAERLARGGR
ncbi:MAG TPA: hypothetical protein VLJ42_10450 [Solirubrobacteraceae bacterium]|nr:hypothetical protein [Solirubrobacteraceae bacterium]